MPHLWALLSHGQWIRNTTVFVCGHITQSPFTFFLQKHSFVGEPWVWVIYKLIWKAHKSLQKQAATLMCRYQLGNWKGTGWTGSQLNSLWPNTWGLGCEQPGAGKAGEEMCCQNNESAGENLLKAGKRKNPFNYSLRLICWMLRNAHNVTWLLFVSWQFFPNVTETGCCDVKRLVSSSLLSTPSHLLLSKPSCVLLWTWNRC